MIKIFGYIILLRMNILNFHNHADEDLLHCIDMSTHCIVVSAFDALVHTEIHPDGTLD